MKKIGSAVIVNACSQRVGAIKKYLGAKDELFVGGEQLKSSALAQVYQEALDTRATAVTAKGEYKTALAARDAAEAKRLAADLALEPYVAQRFGTTGTEAHDFGFVRKKPVARTPVDKAKAALLGKATRGARGTTSPKEKMRIKGTLSPEAALALETLAGSASGAAAPAAAPAPSPPAAPAVASTPVAPAAPVAPVAPVATNGLTGAAHS